VAEELIDFFSVSLMGSSTSVFTDELLSVFKVTVSNKKSRVMTPDDASPDMNNLLRIFKHIKLTPPSAAVGI